jgi:hypothetical protein
VIYREAPTLLEELADATLAGTRKGYIAELATVPLLIVDDLCMRKLAHTAAEDRGNAARQLYLRRDLSLLTIPFVPDLIQWQWEMCAIYSIQHRVPSRWRWARSDLPQCARVARAETNAD